MVSYPPLFTVLLAIAGAIGVVLGGYKSWYLLRASQRRSRVDVLWGSVGLLALLELILGATTVFAIGTGRSLPAAWGATLAIVFGAGVITFERYRSRR